MIEGTREFGAAVDDYHTPSDDRETVECRDCGRVIDEDMVAICDCERGCGEPVCPNCSVSVGQSDDGRSKFARRACLYIERAVISDDMETLTERLTDINRWLGVAA